MIYLFRMISDENQDFCRDVVIDGSDTFLDFHRCIQDNLNYDPSQLASFFITNENWEKQQEITLIDMMNNGSETVPMEQAVIQDFISEVTGRMIYVFDFFSERAFFIELIEKSDLSTDKETPFVGHAKGEAPRQLAVDLLSDDGEPPADMSEDEEDEDQDNIWLDDLDPDSLDPDLPDDF